MRAALTRDPVLQRVLLAIAHDEARHAELGWQTVAWCLQTGGEETRESVLDALARCESAQLASPDRLDRKAFELGERKLHARIPEYLRLHSSASQYRRPRYGISPI